MLTTYTKAGPTVAAIGARIVAACMFTCLPAFALGRCTAPAKTVIDRKMVNDTAQMGTDEAGYWKHRAQEASEAAEEWRQMYEAERSDVTTVVYRLPAKPRIDMLAKKALLTRDDVRYVVTYWSHRYNLSDAATRRLAGIAVDITHDGACESHGRAWAVSGQHVGILQMTPGWGSTAQRMNAVWSLRRLVKCYVESGEAGIAKHWGQTWGC